MTLTYRQIQKLKQLKTLQSKLIQCNSELYIQLFDIRILNVKISYTNIEVQKAQIESSKYSFYVQYRQYFKDIKKKSTDWQTQLAPFYSDYQNQLIAMANSWSIALQYLPKQAPSKWDSKNSFQIIQCLTFLKKQFISYEENLTDWYQFDINTQYSQGKVKQWIDDYSIALDKFDSYNTQIQKLYPLSDQLNTIDTITTELVKLKDKETEHRDNLKSNLFQQLTLNGVGGVQDLSSIAIGVVAPEIGTSNIATGVFGIIDKSVDSVKSFMDYFNDWDEIIELNKSIREKSILLTQKKDWFSLLSYFNQLPTKNELNFKKMTQLYSTITSLIKEMINNLESIIKDLNDSTISDIDKIQLVGWIFDPNINEEWKKLNTILHSIQTQKIKITHISENSK